MTEQEPVVDDVPTPEGSPIPTSSSPDAPPAERMRPQLQLTRVGVVAAVIAAALSATAVGTYPAGAGSDLAFPLATLGVAVLMLVICVLQLALWGRVFEAWRDGREFTDVTAVRVSWWAHWASYPVLLAGIYLAIEASALGGFSDLPGFCLGLAVFALLAAQVTAAVQYLRDDGPPGTIPNHLRRLLGWIRSQR